MASIADIFADRGSIVISGKRGIHQFPGSAVKFNDIVYPASVFGISADPGMQGFSGISYFKFRRYALGAEHGGHYRSIVEADAGP